MKTSTKIENITQQLHSKWEGLRPRDRLILSIFALLFPLFLYTKFIFFPKLQELRNIKEEKIRLQQKVKDYAQKQKILQQLEKEEKVINSILIKALKLLPKKTELSSLLNNIAQQGEKFNITITQLKLGKEQVKDDFYAAIPLKMKLNGNYTNIMLFLDNVRLQKQILSPQEINMSSKNGELNADCIIYTYRILSEEERQKLKQQKRKKKK